MTKFRSWIPSIQTFTYFEDGVYSCPKVQFDKVPFDWDNAEQYFGVKDKNKVDVSIGDIINLQCGDDFNDECDQVYIVSLHEGIQHAVNTDTGEKSQIWNTGNLDYNIHIEVIGNIHETPELLKETT